MLWKTPLSLQNHDSDYLRQSRDKLKFVLATHSGKFEETLGDTDDSRTREEWLSLICGENVHYRYKIIAEMCILPSAGR